MRYKAILKTNDFDEECLVSTSCKYKAVCKDGTLKITKYLKTSRGIESVLYSRVGTMQVDSEGKNGFIRIEESVMHDIFAIMLKKYGVKVVDNIPSPAVSKTNVDKLFKKLDNAFKDDYVKIYCNLKTQNYQGEVLEEVLRGYRQSFSEKKQALKERVDTFTPKNHNELKY